MICRGLASAATSSGSVATGDPGARGRSREVFLGTQGGAVIDDEGKSVAGDIEARFSPITASPISPTCGPC